MTGLVLMIPLLMTIFYPKIGDLLGIIGSFAGLVIVYILPTITYLKDLQTECYYPILAKAIK